MIHSNIQDTNIQDFKVAEAEDKDFSVFALEGLNTCLSAGRLVARSFAPGKGDPPIYFPLFFHWQWHRRIGQRNISETNQSEITNLKSAICIYIMV
jgi:hypothetical protein